MSSLLDVNLLIALAWPSHVHHESATAWFDTNRAEGWATCPLTQLGFVRISSNPRFVDGAVAPLDAIELLRDATADEHHRFLPADIDLAADEPGPPPYLVGHKQVTDAYLVLVAQAHGCRLATLDSGLRTLLPDADRRVIEVVSQA